MSKVKSVRDFKVAPVNLVINAGISMSAWNVEVVKDLNHVADVASCSKAKMVSPRVVNRPYWHSMLIKLYFQDKASSLLYELDNGVYIGRPVATKSIESNIWPSSLEFYDDVTKVIQEDIDLGRALDPLAEPPFDNYIVSALGPFIKRERFKVRVIHDLSYPIKNSH